MPSFCCLTMKAVRLANLKDRKLWNCNQSKLFGLGTKAIFSLHLCNGLKQKQPLRPEEPSNRMSNGSFWQIEVCQSAALPYPCANSCPMRGRAVCSFVTPASGAGNSWGLADSRINQMNGKQRGCECGCGHEKLQRQPPYCGLWPQLTFIAKPRVKYYFSLYTILFVRHNGIRQKALTFDISTNASGISRLGQQRIAAAVRMRPLTFV